MAIQECGPSEQSPMRLRAMIESWERGGLISAEVAERALSPVSSRTAPMVQPTFPLRRLEAFGYVGAVPVAAAGLLLAQNEVGLGPILLIGLLVAVASPRTIRSASRRGGRTRSRPPVPRHRASHRVVVTGESRGPKAREVVLNGSVGARRPATTLVSTNSG